MSNINIFKAIEDNNLEAVKQYLDQGRNIEVKNIYGRTPLHLAVYYSEKGMVEYLIDKGSDVEAKDEDGKTPLHYAVSYDDKEMVELLINKGANIEAKDEDSLTPLHRATYWKHKEIVELLIDKGANIELKDRKGRTPLDIAEEIGSTKMIKLLEDTMSNQRTQESQDYPLHKAIIRTRDESFTESLLNDLLDAGADINGFNNYGYSPLLLACKYGKLNIAKILIQAGADIDAKSYSGHDIVDLLKEDELLALKESLSPCIVNTTPSFARLPEKCALLEKFITYLESEKSDEQAYYTRKKMIALKHAIASHGLEEVGLDPLFHEMISYLNFLKESYDVKKKEGTLKQFKFAKFLER